MIQQNLAIRRGAPKSACEWPVYGDNHYALGMNFRSEYTKAVYKDDLRLVLHTQVVDYQARVAELEDALDSGSSR